MTGDCFLHVRAFMFIISLTLVHKNTLCSWDKYMLASFLFPLSSRWRICSDNSSLQPRNKKHWLTSSQKKEIVGTKKRRAWGRSWRWVWTNCDSSFVARRSTAWPFSLLLLQTFRSTSSLAGRICHHTGLAGATERRQERPQSLSNKLAASPPFY